MGLFGLEMMLEACELGPVFGNSTAYIAPSST